MPLRVSTGAVPDGWGIGFYQAGEVLLRKRPMGAPGEVDFVEVASRALQALEPLLGARPDAWTLAAACALALGARGDAELFASCARERLGAGFVSAHRRERLEAIGASLPSAP